MFMSDILVYYDLICSNELTYIFLKDVLDDDYVCSNIVFFS